jgi:hypothetical protein
MSSNTGGAIFYASCRFWLNISTLSTHEAMRHPIRPFSSEFPVEIHNLFPVSRRYATCITHLLFLCLIKLLIFAKYHHHKHPGLGHLARSVSRVTVTLSIVSSVSQLFSFLVGCSEMILKGFGFVAFFAGVKASSFCIHAKYLFSN